MNRPRAAPSKEQSVVMNIAEYGGGASSGMLPC